MPTFETTEVPTNVRVRNDDAATITFLRAQLDQYLAEMREFSTFDLSDILAKLAAYSAHAAEMRMQVIRSESRRLQAFRTRELDPFLDQCDYQFKVWSRFQSVRQMEFDMSRGGV